jgi:hypothetical protein
MRKSLLSVAAASMFLAGAGLALAQEGNSEPTWTPEQAGMMTQSYTSNKYTSFRDTNMHPTKGMILPNSVTVYALPDTMKSPTADRYQYGMVNDHPVVIESSTRKIVHTWD